MRAVFVDTSFEVCEQRNARRTGPDRVPEVGVRAIVRVLSPPTPAEGFDAVDVVAPNDAGSGPGLASRLAEADILHSALLLFLM